MIKDDLSELNFLNLTVAEVKLEVFACYVDVVREGERLPPGVVGQLESADI